MISTSLHASSKGDLLVVEFNDPKSRNSLSLQAARELQKVWRERSASVKALIFKNSGRVFCSGGNLTDYAAMTTADAGRAVNDEITSILAELSELPLPTIALVRGDCFGGGVELASAFDYIFAEPHVLFALWQRKIGLSFGWGGGSRLENRLGVQRLRSLALSTQSISAGEALEIGLIDRIYRHGEIESAAFAFAEGLTLLPRNPLPKLKTFKAENESGMFKTLWWNEEHQNVLQGRRRT